MGIIQCALTCRYQKEGYCALDGFSAVHSVNTECPYYQPSNDQLEGFTKVSDTNQFD